MSHAAACLQWEATNRSWLQVKKLNPPPPVQLSLVWPLLYKFRDCTRLAQPPLPVPSQRTEPTPSIFPWPQSLLQNPQRYTVRDTQFKVEKAFRGHMAVPLPFYRLLPEDPLLEDGHGGAQIFYKHNHIIPKPEAIIFLFSSQCYKISGLLHLYRESELPGLIQESISVLLPPLHPGQGQKE